MKKSILLVLILSICILFAGCGQQDISDDGGRINPFDFAKVNYYGAAPYITATVENNSDDDVLSKIDFGVKMDKGYLDIGDEFKVFVYIDDEASELMKDKYTLSLTEKTFIVKDVNRYIGNIDDLTDEDLIKFDNVVKDKLKKYLTDMDDEFAVLSFVDNENQKVIFNKSYFDLNEIELNKCYYYELIENSKDVTNYVIEMNKNADCNGIIQEYKLSNIKDMAGNIYDVYLTFRLSNIFETPDGEITYDENLNDKGFEISLKEKNVEDNYFNKKLYNYQLIK